MLGKSLLLAPRSGPGLIVREALVSRLIRISCGLLEVSYEAAEALVAAAASNKADWEDGLLVVALDVLNWSEGSEKPVLLIVGASGEVESGC